MGIDVLWFLKLRVHVKLEWRAGWVVSTKLWRVIDGGKAYF